VQRRIPGRLRGDKMSAEYFNITGVFDRDEKNAITEYANVRTNSNLSKMVRTIVQEWIISQELIDKSPEIEQSTMRIRRKRRKELFEQYEIDYVSLQQDYDKAFEESLKRSAEKHNWPYPPDIDQTELWQYIPELKKTFEAVVWCTNGSDETSLRDVYRYRNISRNEAINQLKQLETYGIVQLLETVKNRSCSVKIL